MLEKTLESPFYSKQIKPVNFKGNQPWMCILKDYWWSWSSSTLTTCCEEPTHWKKPCYWERLRVGGEGGDREWNRWMASLNQWTWVWPDSKRQWRTGKLDMLKSMGITKSWTPWQLNNNNSKKWKDEASSCPYPKGSHNVIFVPDLAKIWLNALWSICIIS